MTTTTKTKTKTPPRARCNVGDIVEGGRTYIVLRIDRGYAVLGHYKPGTTQACGAESWPTSKVRSWPLAGRRRVDMNDTWPTTYTIQPAATEAP